MSLVQRERVKKLSVAPIGKGAHLRVVSPASSPWPERLKRGAEALRELGFAVTLGRHALETAGGGFAGSVDARLDDLHTAFRDPSVDGIISSRGGYGANYLLGRVDLHLVRANPKPFLGYSDLTILQTWLLDTVGLPAFHAPMAAVDFAEPGGVDQAGFMAALGGQGQHFAAEDGLRVLRPGRASGILYGGCLTLLAASMGTPYEPRTEGSLLFLEDLHVKLYQLDRLLRQMLLGGKFSGVAGVIFGEMTQCLAPEETMTDLDAVILRVLEPLGLPIAAGLRSGHVSRRNVTLVFGVPAELDLVGSPHLTVAGV